MTRFIRINDSRDLPGVTPPEHMKKGYVFDSTGKAEIGGFTYFLDADGVAHGSWDIRQHDLPTEAEVMEHIMYHEVEGLRFERRDDDKIERMARIVAALAAGKKVTL